MPHQCVNCSRIIPAGSREILEGCASCHGRFFFYIKDEQYAKLKENKLEVEMPEADKERVEREVREIAGITDMDAPVILDFESVRVTGSGKFEIDIAKVFRKDRPLVYKLEEGKYIIDLATTFGNFKEREDEKN
jgi:predicted  nucleic acid-binding Zn-ribbon protein